MFSFRTRLSPASYFTRLAAAYGSLLAIAFILYVIQTQVHGEAPKTVGYIAMGGTAVVGFVYLISIAKRRANDISEKYAALLTLGLLIFPWGLLLALKGSQPRPNRYG